MSILRTNQICAIAALTCLSLAGGVARAAPVCDTSGSGNPWVCVDKSGADPIEGTDFTFDFSDASNPDVILQVGYLDWVVYSQASSSDATPANLGDITIDPTVLSDDFELTIINGTGDGAENVASIVLNVVNFTGFSSIEAGTINGNVKGNIEVVDDSGGSGGLLNLEVEGNVGGTVSAEDVEDFVIGGDYTGLGMDFTQILILGSLEVKGDLSGDVDLGTLKALSTIKVWGAVAQATTIDITTMELGSAVNLNFDDTSRTAGDLILGNGVPANSAVTIHDLTRTGSVNFTGDDLVGQMVVFGDLAGDIVEVNDITDGWIDIHGTLKGTGRILVDGICMGSHTGSDITIFEATESLSLIRITEGIEGSCAIVINDDEGDFDAGGDIVIGVGGIPLPAVTFDGSILVMDNGTDHGDLLGDIDVIGCHPENHGFLDICIEGDLAQLGAISIVQGSCSDPVCGYQCGGGACP